MILTIDIDGVLAGGEYIPEWERYPERYLTLPLIEEGLPSLIHKLARKHSLYLLSSRAFPNALDYTRLWLEKVGFASADFCGVVVGAGKTEKVVLTQLLQATIHIDDDYRVVDKLERGDVGAPFGLFVYHEAARSHYPWSKKAAEEGASYFINWKDLLQRVELISSQV